jgi:hypothetical protein
MNAKGFIALAAVTVVVTVGAVAAVVDRAQSRGADRLDQLLLPGFLEKANDVTAIAVKSGEKTFTVAKAQSGWAIPEKGGYPALEDKARKAIIDLAKLRVVAEKTHMEDRFARLQVEDPSKKDAKSILVELRGGDKPVASVILGKRKFSTTGKGGEGIYVRLPDKQQAWLAEGEVAVSVDPLDWIDKQVLNIPQDRAAEVRVVPRGGERVIIVREEGKDKGFKLSNPPAGKTLNKDAADKMKDVVTSFESVDLEDVRKAEEVAKGEPEFTVTMVTTDGLIVDLDAFRFQDAVWFTVKASAEAVAAAPAASANPAPAAGGNPAPATGGVQAEAAAINKTAAGWAYKFIDWRTGRLNLQMAALIQ